MKSVLSSTLKISGDAMSYSFTEKKRIRKSFAKRESVQEIHIKHFYKQKSQPTNALQLA
jgi:hypothetical protein